MMDPISAYFLVSHAWGHPLAPWGSIDGKPILDTAGDNMTDVTAAALVAAGIGAEDRPDVNYPRTAGQFVDAVIDAMDNPADAINCSVRWHGPSSNVMVEYEDLGFVVTREEILDNVHKTAIPERMAKLRDEAMRPRKEDGLGAPENPAV